MLNESRVMNGTLKLTPAGTGATAMDLSCQVTNVRISSAYSDDGDAVTTLCGDTVPPPRKLDGHKLEGTIVQDFDLAETDGGVIDFLWAHDLEIVDYEFVPNDVATTPTITGKLQIEIPGDTYGGDVNKRDTSDFSWNLQSKPAFTRTPAPLEASSSKEKAAA
jgi:hypothetical protein